MDSAFDPRILTSAPFPLDEHTDASGYVFVAAHVGSVSHNTHLPPTEGGSDDVDVLGAIMPPIARLIGLEGWDHWTAMIDELDVTFYSLRKFTTLLLKANPNVIGLLWLNPEHYLVRSREFELFMDIRDDFSSLEVGRAFSGYAYSQLKQMDKNQYAGYMGTRRKALVDIYGYDIKHAAHLVRLLRMGIEFLRDGVLQVYRTDDADQLRSIKRGEWTLNQVQAEANRLFVQMEAEQKRCSLPAKPNAKRVEEVLVALHADWICHSGITDALQMVGAL